MLTILTPWAFISLIFYLWETTIFEKLVQIIYVLSSIMAWRRRKSAANSRKAVLRPARRQKCRCSVSIEKLDPDKETLLHNINFGYLNKKQQCCCSSSVSVAAICPTSSAGVYHARFAVFPRWKVAFPTLCNLWISGCGLELLTSDNAVIVCWVPWKLQLIKG